MDLINILIRCFSRLPLENTSGAATKGHSL